MKTICSIVVTFNGSKWIERCLNSLVQSNYPNEIIVIDNGSTDTTLSVVRNLFPQVQLVETNKNLGFGKANNIGFRLALEKRAEYVFLLNQDAWIEPDTLALLVEIHNTNKQLGIISPIHLNGEGTGLDRFFYDYFMKSDLNDFLGINLLSRPGKNEYIKTYFVNAAAWLIDKECLNYIGGFDPIFFHYGEDKNFAQRALFKGYKIGIVPSARMYHDREERIKLISNGVSGEIKKDFTNFLVYACNIRRPGYRFFVFKRMTRHLLLILTNSLMLNGRGLKYNFSMASNIIFSINEIGKSRRRSYKGGIIIS